MTGFWQRASGRFDLAAMPSSGWMRVKPDRAPRTGPLDRGRAPAGRSHPGAGFTLIETLVVLVISVGLVILMAALFRQVGHATLALGGDQEEFGFQQLARDQLSNTLALPGDSIARLNGDAESIRFLTWKSRRLGFDGKPVVVEYRLEPKTRAIIYREADLPAWWAADRVQFDDGNLLDLLRASPESVLVRGVETLRIEYMAALPTGADFSLPQDRWNVPLPPRLVHLTWERGARTQNLWLDVKATNV